MSCPVRRAIHYVRILRDGALATAAWILPLALQAYTVADVLIVPSIITSSLVMTSAVTVHPTSLLYIALGASLLMILA